MKWHSVEYDKRTRTNVPCRSQTKVADGGGLDEVFENYPRMESLRLDASGISIYMGGKTPFANTDVQGGAYSEVQTINLSNESSGQWRVAFNGEVSNALSVSISAADLKTALDNFAGIDNVTVTGSSGSFTVTFGGTQTGVNVSQLFGDASSASCGSTVQTITSSYNANDQLTSISDPNATINYTLDSLG